MFKRKGSITQKSHQTSSSSLLSQLVRNTSQVPENPFIEFSKFNGEVSYLKSCVVVDNYSINLSRHAYFSFFNASYACIHSIWTLQNSICC